MTYRIVRGPDGTSARHVLRVSDGASIPADPLNTDWRAYQAWLKAGNAPPAETAVEPTAGPTRV